VTSNLGFLLQGMSERERTARCRELRALALVYVGSGHPLTVAVANPDATTQALAELDRLPALRRRRLLAALTALLPRAARTGTPARPQIVTEGSADSPSRQMWRDPQSNLYDATSARMTPGASGNISR
jgi:hypothetical protein